MNLAPQKDVVLIVDDEVVIRHMVGRIAATIPHVEVMFADNAKDALSLVKTASLSLVISDLNMPGHSGAWLLEQVREMGMEVPFVVFSGSLSGEDESLLLRLGANRILAKPAPPVVLRNLMVEMLSKKFRFELVEATGKEVFVAGSFNNWNPRQHRMNDDMDPGFYTATLLLQRGRYEYKFIVDGTWCVDPKSTHGVTNAFGTMNNVIEV